jgi:amino acid transporter
MTELRRVLGLRDVVFLNIVAVIGLRWLARGARAGAPAVTLWVLAWLCFFLPLAVTLIVLSRRYPEQGGLYVWVRRAFGPFHGAICGWCLWVNNLFYFPTLLLFAAANVAVLVSGRMPDLANSRWYSTVFVLGLLWALVALNIRGFRSTRWLQSAGAISTWVPAALVIVAGGIALAVFGSATSFAPSALVPRDEALSTIALWSGFCFAFSGLEIGAFSSAEVERPERTLPLGILIGGAIATVIYIAGTAAILIVLPTESLAERSGIADAVDAVASRVGLPALGPLTALLIAAGTIAGTSSWMAATARISFAGSLDRLWPSAMARLHPVYRTPHVALVVQGVISTLIFLPSLFLTLGGGQTTTVQEAYDILLNVTVVIYFVPYLYLFVALIQLDRQTSAAQSDGAPAGGDKGSHRAWTWTLAGVGFAAAAIAVALTFVPPTGTANRVNYVVNLLVQTAVVIGAGIALYAIMRRRPTSK